jgi:hypothetical protein
VKKIGEYTARGIVTEAETEAGSPQRIPLFDGRFDTGYRIIDFKIWTSNVLSGSAGAAGKLSKNPDGSTSRDSFFRADDDNQIGWAVTEMTTDAGTAGGFTDLIIDQDNLVIEDLYVYVRAEGNTTPINYMVTMEKYQITDWQGALAMARDRAQGDL